MCPSDEVAVLGVVDTYQAASDLQKGYAVKDTDESILY